MYSTLSTADASIVDDVTLTTDDLTVATDDLTVAADVTQSPLKQQKLISLQYNLSDSEDEETRGERKARIVSTRVLYWRVRQI